MKKILSILLLVFLFVSVKAQLPKGFPITDSKGWVKYAYVQSDSGSIVALRDTLWLPRFPGTEVYWRHVGVDSVKWIFNGKTIGKKWDKVGSGGGSGSLDGDFPIIVSGSKIIADTSKTKASLVTWYQLRQLGDSAIKKGDTLFYSISPCHFLYDTLTGIYTLYMDSATAAQDGYLSVYQFGRFNSAISRAAVVGDSLRFYSLNGDSSTVYVNTRRQNAYYWKGRRIYGFLDSYGYGVGTIESWFKMMAKMVGGIYYDLGLPGSTLENRVPVDYQGALNMIERLPTIPVKSLGDGAIIIALGTNDFPMGPTSNYTPANYVTDYKRVIDTCLARGWQPQDIILCSPYFLTIAGYTAFTAYTGNPVITRPWANLFTDSTAAVANFYGLSFVNFSKDQQYYSDTTQFDADHIHLNTKGHEFLANDFIKQLNIEKTPVSDTSTLVNFTTVSGVTKRNVANSADSTVNGKIVWWSNGVGGYLNTGVSSTTLPAGADGYVAALGSSRAAIFGFNRVATLLQPIDAGFVMEFVTGEIYVVVTGSVTATGVIPANTDVVRMLHTRDTFYLQISRDSSASWTNIYTITAHTSSALQYIYTNINHDAPGNLYNPTFVQTSAGTDSAGTIPISDGHGGLKQTHSLMYTDGVLKPWGLSVKKLYIPDGSQGAGKVLTSVDGSGLTTWSTPTGGSQTPWTSNINGGAFSLTNVNNISAETYTGSAANSDIVLIDGAGNRAFRSVNTSSWVDNALAQFFQIGGFNTPISFTAQGGTTAARMQFLSSLTQISAGGYNTAPVPTENFEIISSSDTKVASITNSGDIKFSRALMPGGSAGTSGQALISAGAGASPTWGVPAASAVPLNNITAATGTNSIDNGTNQQTWRWNSLAGNIGFALNAGTTAAASNSQTLFNATLSGANSNSSQLTMGAFISNTHTGTSSTNIAMELQAAGGTNNYALIVGASKGSVGIGNSAPTSTLDVTGGSFSLNYVAKTANYTATATDQTIDCTSGTFQVTAPTAVGIPGRIYTIKNSGLTSVITVGTTSSQTIDGGTTYTLPTQFKYVTIMSNGANWIVIANN